MEEIGEWCVCGGGDIGLEARVRGRSGKRKGRLWFFGPKEKDDHDSKWVWMSLTLGLKVKSRVTTPKHCISMQGTQERFGGRGKGGWGEW